MAPILYINLLVGEFLWNYDAKLRRYTTARVWGVSNWLCNNQPLKLMASRSFYELKRENQTAPSKYINLCVGKFSWNNVKKVRRYTTAMVWGVWNRNTQQSTTQINGEPLIFRIWA
jgi:hypothetical protein